MRVKTAEMTAESLRETGVARMGLLRKLYEKSEVRVLEYPPIWQGSQVVRRQPAKLRIVSSTLTLASICPLSLAGQSVRLRTARPGVQISQGIPAD